MKTILVIFILNVLIKEGSCGTNPCPDIIEFKSDGNEDFAVITIAPSLVSKFNTLNVKLEIREEPKRGDNVLKLVKSKDEVVTDIKQGKNIEFKLNFLQSGLLPIITKITINRKNICNAVEGFGEYKYDVEATFILSSLPTPTPSATPQLSAKDTSFVQWGNASWLQTLPFAGTCGRQFKSTQTIIGGEEVTEGEYPWMVAMSHYKQGHFKKYVCGASLISDTYVITAAHCTQNQTQVLLEFGKYNLDKLYEAHSAFRTSWKIISHPDYKNAALGDVALVAFSPPVTFTKWIVPICLWGNFDSELHRGTVAGWGQQDNNDKIGSTTPKKLTISMVNLTICRNSHLVLQEVATNKTFCAGGAGAGPCHGDSGGGFFITHRHVQYLRGIISQSIGNEERCNVDEYAVYADLAHALDWLRPYLTADAVRASVATQKCEEYKQLRANIGKSSSEGTSVSQYSHMVFLGFGDSPTWACTGTLISEQFILAELGCLLATQYLLIKELRAHHGCDDTQFFDEADPLYFKEHRCSNITIDSKYGSVSTAHLGFLDLRNKNNSGTLQEFKIIETYKHSLYKPPKNYANIALLKLDRPVEYTKEVAPACLHEDFNIPTDDVQEIAWYDDGTGENSDLLQVTNVTLISVAECTSDKEKIADTNFESFFCAKSKEEECSFGLTWRNYSKPLQILDKSGTPKIVGIRSSHRPCPSPYIYIRVSNYVPWIESIVWPGAPVHSTD